MSTHYCRYRIGGETGYALLEEGRLHAIDGGLFGERTRTGVEHDLAAVRLLPPCEPSKIIGVGLNYRSHLGGRKLPETPELFYKPTSSLVGHNESIVIPRDATDVHFEGELVIVIGKSLKTVSRDEAIDGIFGVTCGNDVSERGWQRGEQKDLQWWRAKGSDTFAPLGPAIVTGIDYYDLLLTTRVNGEVMQLGSTADLVHDCADIVRWASQWVTLLPGDVIYTGTPGNTVAMKPGDVVEVEIEDIGTLRNSVE